MTLRKLAIIVSLTIIILSIVGWIWWDLNADRVIESAFNGTSLPLVNKYVGIHKSIDPTGRTLEYFLRNGRPVVPRLFGLIIVLQLLILAARRYGKSAIKQFFSQVTHPVNLAGFRIILFTTILFYTNIPLIVQYSGFPEELRAAPFGLGWLLSVLPINPALSAIISWMFLFVCLCGIAGFYSRTSAALVALLGIYVLGIPQFFGKIDHYHHLLWFAALLAASPCGDVFSIDSFIAGKKGRDPLSLERSNVYLLPLRFVMLLMGIIYFFAGFWKFVIGGIAWGTGETMKDILYAQWFRLDWMPLFRIDHYPLLCRMSGLGVMTFELVFIFLLFVPRLRNLAAIGGLLFHVSVYLFAHINFWNLAVCYVVFLDFEPLYRRWTARSGPVHMKELPEKAPGDLQRRIRPEIIVGATLVSINILFGIALIDSWPFAVYPTFAGVEEKYLQSLTIVLTNPDSSKTEINPYKDRALQETLHPSRMIGLFTQVLWEPDTTKAKSRAVALMHLLSGIDVRFQRASAFRIYRDVCTVIPEEQKENPLRRQLLLSLR